MNEHSPTATAGQLREQARRRARHAVLGLAATVAVALVAFGWLAVRGPGGGPAGGAGEDPAGRGPAAPVVTAPGPPAPPPSHDPSAAVGAAAPIAAAAAETAYVAPARWVTLPPAGRAIDEYPVEFEHIAEGAVALTVRLVEYGWALDPAEFARAARVYTTPDHAERVAAQATQATTAWRATLGLPAGPLPAGAGMSVRPTGAMWQELGPDRVRVSVLAEVTAYYGDGRPDRAWPVSVTSDVVWVDELGDWRVTASDRALPAPTPARLGTAEFNAAGWVGIAEEPS